jgi:hypothetical protein
MEYGLVRAGDAIKDQQEGNYSYLKYEHNSKINIMFIYNCLARYIMYYRSIYLFCRGLVQSTSLLFMLADWITREGQKDHRLDGRTTWQLDFSTDQLVRPIDSWTLSPTSRSDCSVLISTRRSLHRRPAGRTTRALTSARRTLRRRPVGQIARHFGSIVSYAEGSPAKLGTLWRSDSSCKSC